MTYYAIVTFGTPSSWCPQCRSFYRSLDRAIADASRLEGGSMTTIRILRCPSRRAAQDANIGDRYPVVWER